MIDQQIVISSVAVLSGLGAVFGAGLAIASKVFAVEVDPRVERINEMLPGANCGACGKAGCAAFAQALVESKGEPTECPVCNQEVRIQIADLLGLTVDSTVVKKARLFCNGSLPNSKEKFNYLGITDCRSAVLIGKGPKKCFFGCIGLGSCIDKCPFDALYMGKDGLPKMIEARCTACGKCVEACPKDLFKLVPEDKAILIRCSSPEKGKTVKEACKAGCIVCGICEKRCPVNAITIENNLAKIDPDKCITCGLCIEKCPMGTIKDMIPADEKKYAAIIEEKCIGCGLCLRVCPVDAPSEKIKTPYTIDKEKCIGCGLCLAKCKPEAIVWKKYEE